MPRTNRSIALPLRAGAVLAAVLAAAVLSGALAACGSAEAPPQMPPPEVGVLQIRPGAMPLDLEYAARLRGAREVEVRARVSGILLERNYEEGASSRKASCCSGSIPRRSARPSSARARSWTSSAPRSPRPAASATVSCPCRRTGS
jgi:hypothetical protein